jgi:hypothetical protein
VTNAAAATDAVVALGGQLVRPEALAEVVPRTPSSGDVPSNETNPVALLAMK